jgi:hypothetical protein
MAKQRPTDSGLPRRQPGRALDDETPITPHPHATPDGAEVHHRHKMGQLPHDHDDEGRPVLPGQAKMVPAKPDMSHWTCAANVFQEGPDPKHYVCDRHDKHDPDPAIDGHHWREVPHPATDDTLVTGNTDVLPAAAPNTSGQATTDPSPPAIPRDSGEALEPSQEAHGLAGSEGGGAGRSLAGRPTATDSPTLNAAGPSLTLNRPDASEKVLGAAMGVINPATDPAFAIRHAEESARVLIIGQHFADMLKAISPPAAQLVEEKDVRGMYHWLRLIAATHGIDLDDNGGES